MELSVTKSKEHLQLSGKDELVDMFKVCRDGGTKSSACLFCRKSLAAFRKYRHSSWLWNVMTAL